jgi:hypothetical protein
VSPVKYELGFYIPEDDILHSHRSENLKSYIALTDWTVGRRCNVFPVRYELGFLSQKTTFFIVTAVKTSNLTRSDHSASKPDTSQLVKQKRHREYGRAHARYANGESLASSLEAFARK